MLLTLYFVHSETTLNMWVLRISGSPRYGAGLVTCARPQPSCSQYHPGPMGLLFGLHFFLFSITISLIVFFSALLFVELTRCNNFYIECTFYGYYTCICDLYFLSSTNMDTSASLSALPPLHTSLDLCG